MSSILRVLNCVAILFCVVCFFFFFKQKTAYEMRISDWSSDVCSSDLFAIGAIATLVLDVTKTVGFFALTGLDFNLTAVAALLPLIGYSVNDKVVVYDRMRANIPIYKRMPLPELVHPRLNPTTSPTLHTHTPPSPDTSPPRTAGATP